MVAADEGASVSQIGPVKGQLCCMIHLGNEGLHGILMDPALRERVYRRSCEKAIQDYFDARGHVPYATDAEKAGESFHLEIAGAPLGT